MRQKELRLALVCYGGVSLAVYMHGVTKEIWSLARASRAYHSPDNEALSGTAQSYREFLEEIERSGGLRLRILPDILTGASAGGINAVFLAQAITTGQSLEPLTDLWLENADVVELTDTEAQPMWRYAKIWTQPIVDWFLNRPGNAVNHTVSPETREEVRRKVSSLVRGRWFSPPFSGDRFSAMLLEAFQRMADRPSGKPLLPAGHLADLFVTATDFRGHIERLRLNSPPIVEETEHRMPIAFRTAVNADGRAVLGDRLDLVLAARATASFPGAFPPLRIEEIDRLARSAGENWLGRRAFLQRIMPAHYHNGTLSNVSLIDGSVLVNAPFGGAIAALHGRPSQREVDRRFVYVDPRPDRIGAFGANESEPIGFFGAVFGSLSTIPREQPIRDDLERIDQQSRDAQRLRRIVVGMQPEIDRAVERLFGYTFFLDNPTPRRLNTWRTKAQQAASVEAGFAYQAYAQTKLSGVVDRVARVIRTAVPDLKAREPGELASVLRQHLAKAGLVRVAGEKGGASDEAIAFFRKHDIGFRIRRLQWLARRLSREWEDDPEISDDALDVARERIYTILALYGTADKRPTDDPDFAALASKALEQPGPALEHIAAARRLIETDAEAEKLLSAALEEMPKNLRQRMLLTYLGFPYYDIATLPLLQHEHLDEFNPALIDRISPDDARSIREGGTRATLKGIEFYNFGAFFSRAYRENDYLWGRLHGAERMIDIVGSTVPRGLDEAALRAAKRSVFLAIVDEEERAGRCGKGLLAELRAEIVAKLG
ncbi:MAG: patatin-like protein [Pseudomonadota bacterium]